MKFAAAFAAAALTITAVSPAFAENVRQREVSFADLDLSTQQGQEALTHRVNRAIAQVCDPNGVRPVGETQDCYADARANVLSSASAPARTALATAWNMDATAQYAARATSRQ